MPAFAGGQIPEIIGVLTMQGTLWFFLQGRMDGA